MTAILEGIDLTAGYGDLMAIRNLSIAVEPGSVHLLLGRNGAGKTTTLSALAGLIPSKSGIMKLRGEDLAEVRCDERVHRGLALVQEGKRIFTQRTVDENLIVGGFSVSHRRRALAGRLMGVYDRFPILREKKHDRAGSLSGGQQQMLAIAQALMANPKVIMLDEPSAGLAPAILADVMRIIVELRSDGLGVLLVEQVLEGALEVADEVTLIEQGTVVLRCAAKDIDPGTIRDTYMGEIPLPV
jgi:branched-chain amino acid transport system ATP-binding protein